MAQFRDYAMERERRAGRGPDGARCAVSTANPSEGSGHRLGTMRDGYERYFDVRLDEHLPSSQVNNDDDCVTEESRSLSCVPPTHPAALGLLTGTLSGAH